MISVHSADADAFFALASGAFYRQLGFEPTVSRSGGAIAPATNGSLALTAWTLVLVFSRTGSLAVRA